MPTFESLKDFLKKYKDIRLNKNILTYLICVVIASVLWFLNILNQDYSAELSYPLKYTNLPEDKYPSTTLPTHLQLEVKAKGFSLLGHHIKTSFLPITLNFATYSQLLRKQDNFFEYTLNTDDIKEKIASQISSDIQIINIYPENIVFRFAPSSQKKVAIQPDLSYTLKRQYIINQITSSPDSVIISGPANVIDTLQQITTSPWKLKEVGKKTQKNLKLNIPENCRSDKENATITLEVEQFTEVRRTINIIAQHVPDSLNLRLFPSSIQISYEIGLSKYENVGDNDFIFAVDYPKETNISYLQVYVHKVPSFIKNLEFSPQKVEFIIEKK